MTNGLRDDGTRVELPSGGMKQRTPGRGRYDLIPPGPLRRLAIHYERGGAKYGDHNWESGLPTSWYMDSLLRHAFQYLAGDVLEDHLAAIAWNAFAIMHTEEFLLDFQDIPARRTE